jgi:hypothetical protein
MGPFARARALWLEQRVLITILIFIPASLLWAQNNGESESTILSTQRPSPASKVKVAIQKLQIFILATPTVKNTLTIHFILLFISLKYYFVIFFNCFILFLSLPSNPSPSPTTGQPHQPANPIVFQISPMP